MPDTVTPPAPGEGAGATPEGANGIQPGNGGTPTFASDKERADHYEARHKEATTALQDREEQIRSLKPAKAETPAVTPAKPAADNQPQSLTRADVEQTVEETVEFTTELSKQPNLKPHKDEIKKLMSTGELSFEEASETVARRHNIARVKPDGRELLPSSGAPGNRDAGASGNESPEQIASDAKQGITPELKAKHAPTLARVWGKAGK